MLAQDAYVLHSPYKDLPYETAVQRIAETIGLSTKKMSSLLTVLCADTLCFTHEELRRLLPKGRNAYINHVEKTAIPFLTKQGFLCKKNLSKTVGTSKRVFVLTKKGYEEASELKGGLLFAKYPSGKKRGKAEEIIRVHNLCAGMNVFQMLFLGIPFSYEREKVFRRMRALLSGRRSCRWMGFVRSYPGKAWAHAGSSSSRTWERRRTGF